MTAAEGTAARATRRRHAPLVRFIRAAHEWALYAHCVWLTAMRCCTAVSQQAHTVQNRANISLLHSKQAVTSCHTRAHTTHPLVSDPDEQQCGCVACVRRCELAKLQKWPLCALGSILDLAV